MNKEILSLRFAGHAGKPLKRGSGIFTGKRTGRKGKSK